VSEFLSSVKFDGTIYREKLKSAITDFVSWGVSEQARFEDVKFSGAYLDKHFILEGVDLQEAWDYFFDLSRG